MKLIFKLILCVSWARVDHQRSAHAVHHNTTGRSDTLYDSGTPVAITNDLADLLPGTARPAPGVSVGTGGGDVSVDARGRSLPIPGVPVDTLCCTTFPVKLDSGPQFDRLGFAAVIQGGRTYILPQHVQGVEDATHVATYTLNGDDAYVKDEPRPAAAEGAEPTGTGPGPPTMCFLAQTYIGSLNSSDLWHARTHMNNSDLGKYVVKDKSSPKPCFCEACVMAKITRQSRSGHKHDLPGRPGSQFHWDLLGARTARRRQITRRLHDGRAVLRPRQQVRPHRPTGGEGRPQLCVRHQATQGTHDVTRQQAQTPSGAHALVL